MDSTFQNNFNKQEDNYELDMLALRDYIQERLGESVVKKEPGAIHDFISLSGANTDEILRYAVEHGIELQQFVQEDKQFTPDGSGIAVKIMPNEQQSQKSENIAKEQPKTEKLK